MNKDKFKPLPFPRLKHNRINKKSFKSIHLNLYKPYCEWRIKINIFWRTFHLSFTIMLNFYTIVFKAKSLYFSFCKGMPCLLTGAVVMCSRKRNYMNYNNRHVIPVRTKTMYGIEMLFGSKVYDKMLSNVDREIQTVRHG